MSQLMRARGHSTASAEITRAAGAAVRSGCAVVADKDARHTVHVAGGQSCPLVGIGERPGPAREPVSPAFEEPVSVVAVQRGRPVEASGAEAHVGDGAAWLVDDRTFAGRETQAEVHVLEVGGRVDRVEAGHRREVGAPQEQTRRRPEVDDAPEPIARALRIVAIAVGQHSAVLRQQRAGLLKRSVRVQQARHDGRDAGLVDRLEQRCKPTRADDGVAVEEHQVAATCLRGALVACGSEPTVLLVEDHASALEPRELLCGAVGGRVVDDDDLERLRRALHDRLQRRPRPPPATVRDHHDGDERRRRRGDAEGHRRLRSR